jgi:UPF0755 protein
MALMLRWVALLAMLSSVAIVAMAVNAVRLLDVPAATQLTYELLPGASAARVARDLAAKGAIQNAALMRWYAVLTAQASRLQAGEYAIRADDTVVSIVERMVRGQTVVYTVTLVEGLTFKQFRAALAAAPHLKQQTAQWSDTKIMAALGRANEHPEGWFFPDTYVYRRGVTDLDILKRAAAAMRKRLAGVWADREVALPYKSAYEALTMASIIEKETGAAHERAQIAGVFVRRLQKKMLLQTDPTVIYGMGERFDGNIRRKDLREDTPYNTYVNKGLTPTPIANPGFAALHAAVHPAAGDTLFFVSKGDGTHHFSATYAEHKRAVRRYQLKPRRKQ